MVVLITSVGTATAVNFIKYLKKQENTIIIGTDTNKMGYTAGSILSDRFYQVPYADDANFVNIIQDIIKKEKAEYMIPVNDAEIEKLSSSIAGKGFCKKLIPDHETVLLTRNKKRCNELVASMGIYVPDELEKNTEKKRIRRDIVGVGSKGITVYEENEKTDKFDPDTQIIQDFIEGSEYTVDVLCDPDGRPLYIIPRKRLEVKSGVATKALIEKKETLIAVVMKILDRIKLPGLSNIQFIEDKEGKLWFMEINCRFSGCGAGTALACEQLLPSFFAIMDGRKTEIELNEGVRWNTVITRYYQEVLYEKETSIHQNGAVK